MLMEEYKANKKPHPKLAALRQIRIEEESSDEGPEYLLWKEIEESN